MTEEPTKSSQTVSAGSSPFRFRIIHLIYIVTVLSSALATFGPRGLWPGAAVCGFWAFVFTNYDFDEPWDGPNNSKLLSAVPSVYSCPASSVDRGLGHTSYFAVVGPQTVWPDSSARQLSDIADGLAKTILVVEHDGRRIPWLAPRDLEYAAAADVLTPASRSGGHHSEDFFRHYSFGRNVAFADGSVRFVSSGVSRDDWAALLGTSDGVAWTDDDLAVPPVVQSYWKVGNCFRFGIFVLLIVFPVPWMWLNPTSGLQQAGPAKVKHRLGLNDD